MTQRAARAERAGRGRRRRPAAGADRAALPDQRARGRPAHASRREFENIIVKAGSGRHAGPAAGRRPRRARRRELRERPALQRRRGGRALASPSCPSANALDVVRPACVAELERLAKTFPPGMKYQVVVRHRRRSCRTRSARSSRRCSRPSALVVLVMFLFLQDWRSTIIPTVTIPVSLVGTFAFVKLLGFSINTLTLFGIVLATGIVVDDAIVVIENIQRHIHEYGRTARQAAVGGDGRGARRRHRDGARADRGVRAGGVLPRHDGPALPAVLADDRVFGGAVGVQRPHADAGAVGAAAAKEREKGAFFRVVERVIDGGHARLRRGVRARRSASRWRDGAAVRRRARRDGLGLSSRCRRRSCPTRTRATSSSSAGARRARRSSTRATSRKQVEADPADGAGHRRRVLGHGLQLLRRVAEPRACCSSGSSRIDERAERRAVGARRSSARLRGRARSASAARSSSRSCRRRSGASAPSAGSSSRCSTRPAAPIENLAAATQDLVRRGQPVSRQLRGLFTSFTAGDPQLVVDIDRERVKALACRSARSPTRCRCSSARST